MTPTDEAAPQDSRLVILPPLLLRVLLPIAWFLFGGLGTVAQLTHHHLPWLVMLVAGAPLMAWLGRKPVLVADTVGVRTRRQWTRWTEVTAVQPPPNDGWRHQLTVLLLADGTRRPLMADMEPADIGSLQRLFQVSGNSS